MLMITYYSSKSECKPQIKVPSPEAYPKVSQLLRQTRDGTVSIRVLPPSG